MSSPPAPYIVGNVYYTHFQTRVGLTHPDYRGTYTPPEDYIVSVHKHNLPKENVIRLDTPRTNNL